MIWGLNTPVQEGWHRNQAHTGKLQKIGRLNRDVREYNAASIEVMKQLDVPVNDLFTPLWEAGLENVIMPDGVHLNRRGSELLGRKVADAVVKHSSPVVPP